VVTLLFLVALLLCFCVLSVPLRKIYTGNPQSYSLLTNEDNTSDQTTTTAQNTTPEVSTTQDTTAEVSTAQDTTAEVSTAQDTTAEVSTTEATATSQLL